MMYCEHCGFANRQGSRYCNACGYRLVSESVEVDEPLPEWLRQATVAGYLWKGEELLPDWLAAVRPFRELFGGGAVVLPPPFEEVVDGSPPSDSQYVVAQAADDNAIFDVDDEEGPTEGDLLLLDDLELTTAAMDEEATVPSTDVSPYELQHAVQASTGSQMPSALDAVAGPGVEEDGEGESILEVLSAVLRPDDSQDEEVRLGTDEPVTNSVPTHVQSVTVEAEIAPPRSAQAVDEGVVAESEGAAPDPDTTNSVDIPSAPHSSEINGVQVSAVPGSTDGPASAKPVSELGENGRRFQSAAGYVLKPQSERPSRKARRKRKK